MNLLVSYNWLKEYVKLKAEPGEFAARLSLSGPSVERIHRQGAGLEKVVVGKVLKVKPHPNADKLRVAETDIGQGVVKEIVCGGSNLSEGQLVAVALPGAMVRWHGEGEPVEIKETKLRGVDSFGMICAANEIGLFDQFPHGEREIVDLTSTAAKPGASLAVALGLNDVVFDVEVTTNRPDAFSIVGMAREAAAIFDADFLWKPSVISAKATARKAEGKGARNPSVAVEAKRLCPRYMAAAMTGAKVGPSPSWMRARLVSAGVRPINSLVDITNYVMLELGQPMHVFDRAKLKGDTIVVREARDGEAMKALDGNEYKLYRGQMIIADAERPVAVAGIMGGEETGATEATTDIVFEAATFEPVSVRRAGRALNLHSDSSLRFEKGLSTESPEAALARAVELAREICGAELAGPIVDIRAEKYKPLSFPFSPEKAEELIGVKIPAAEMKRILSDLGFGVKASGKNWKVSVPYWRDHDIEDSRDLIEEVARVYGYGNLPSDLPEGALPPVSTPPALVWEDRAKRLFKGWGFTECLTYSFVSKRLLELVGAEPSKAPRLDNPLTADLEYMRTDLIGSLLAVVAENQEIAESARVFEIANLYRARENDLPDETPRMTLVSWSKDTAGADLLALKGAVGLLFKELGIRDLRLSRASVSGIWHPGRSLDVSIGETRVGTLGEIHPATLGRFRIERRVAVADLDFAAIAAAATLRKSYAPIPEFPSVKRDIAFLVDEHVEHASLVGRMEETDKLLTGIELFDVFQDKEKLALSKGDGTGGKKSLAYHLEFSAPNRTLTAEEVEKVMEKLRDMLKKEFGAESR